MYKVNKIESIESLYQNNTFNLILKHFVVQNIN